MTSRAMRKLVWCSVASLCVLLVTCVPVNRSMIEWLVEHVKKLQYYEVVVFKNFVNSFDNDKFELLLVEFVRRVQTLLVDVEKIEYVNGTDQPRYSPSPGIFRASALCIILQDGRIDNPARRADHVMKFLTKVSPTLTRPKCLMISDNSTHSEQSFADTLLRAWSLKFLDFTIVSVSKHGLQKMVSYNPFTMLYNISSVKNSSVLFPDKLDNMYEYPLKIPIYYLPPYNTFQIEDGRITSVDGYDYPFVEIFSQKLNFSLQYFIVEEASNVTALFEKVILLLESSKANLIPKPLYLGTHYYGRNVVIGKPYRDTNYVLIVPILPMSKVDLYLSTMATLSFFPLNVLILNVVLRPLRFRWNKWIYLLQMLVGSALKRPPIRVAERIMFFTIVLLAMIFSSDIFATLTDTNVAVFEEPFDDFGDITSSDLRVYARVTASEQENEIFTLLGVENIKNISQCLFEATRTKCCICIAPKLAAKFLISAFEEGEKPTLKIAPLTLYSEKMAFGFEEASPYVEKIDLVTQALIEAGIPFAWKHTRTYESKYQKKREDRDTDKESLTKIIFQFAALVMIFYSVAAVVFGLEFLVFKTLPRVRRAFKRFRRVKHN